MQNLSDICLLHTTLFRIFHRSGFSSLDYYSSHCYELYFDAVEPVCREIAYLPGTPSIRSLGLRGGSLVKTI